ncbi:hypothetical protein [Sorangium cellulosum]|nr:hypothetical protein [Sorangium cellulosum]
MDFLRLARMATLTVATLAGGACGAPPAPIHHGKPIEPPPRPPPPPPSQPPSEPARTLELELARNCPRADASLPDLPAPDPALLAAVLERPWCFDTSDGIRQVTFAGDGGFTIEERGPDDELRATRGGCWGMTGTGLLLNWGDRRWDEWPVQYIDPAHGGMPTLIFRGQRHRPCTVAVAPESPPV